MRYFRAFRQIASIVPQVWEIQLPLTFTFLKLQEVVGKQL